MISGGELIVQGLQAQGVERVFCVPGESYLAVLDALHGSKIDTIVCRQEGGAAMMAEADGKMTGRPGIAMVTRGPGATNAACGVHVAQQDSTPMILLIGQIGRRMRGRDAFQEVDYRQFFGGMAKWVEQIEFADRIPETLAHAYHIAMSGRPGPVVLALPEDMLRDSAEVAPAARVEVAEPAPTSAAMEQFADLFRDAQRPFVVVGGGRWDAAAVARLKSFAERWQLPVGCSFRRQHLFDHCHGNYAGDVGLGINPALLQRLKDSDLLLLLGARFSENPSQSFSLLKIPVPDQTVIHVHPGPEELGRIYLPSLAINATPKTFLHALEQIEPPKNPAWAGNEPASASAAHSAYLSWTDEIPQGGGPEGSGSATMSGVMSHLRDALSDDAILTNGAGNYAIWLNRYYRYRQFGTQIAPTSGSMGYGLPAAVAAKLRYPERSVICLAGDGCFQMSMQEFGTAVQHGANIIVLVADNGIYGTIRMHQEQFYPGRISATDMVNPDFAALAETYGAFGATVTNDADFPVALAEAMTATQSGGRPALIHLKLDARDIAPGRRLE